MPPLISLRRKILLYGTTRSADRNCLHCRYILVDTVSRFRKAHVEHAIRPPPSTQARHPICLSFTRIQPRQPPTPSMLPSSLSLRLSGILSWCNKKSPSASLIPYHLAHSQPHVDDGVLVSVGTSQAYSSSIVLHIVLATL